MLLMVTNPDPKLLRREDMRANVIAPEWQAAVWVINPFLDYFK